MATNKRRGRPSEGQLGSERIINTASTIFEESSKIPSIRQLAKELEVDPMAIYHYFPNKNAMLEALVTSLIDGIYKPNPCGEWRAELETLCESYIQQVSRYPGLLEVILAMNTESLAELFAGRLEIILDTKGLDKKSMRDILSLIGDYMHGYLLAMQCNPGKIDQSYLHGPLDLVCLAIEQRASHTP